MSSLSLKHVTKAYPNGFVAVKDFSLQVQDQEFLVLAGPQGCGKSTILRVIAGLEDVTSGEVWLEDRLVNDAEPGDREIAMLFKNSVLYPDMTVYGNLAFGLKLKHMPEGEIDRRVREAAGQLGLSALLEKTPDALSKGEALRVALGRVVVRSPRLILMDEPFSSLEWKLQDEMRRELSRLHRELGLTIVYVAHDQAEACVLGTRIVLMKDGVIQQADTLEQIYDRPNNVFAAGYMGSPQMNRVDVVARKGGGAVILTAGADALAIRLPEDRGRLLEEQGYLDRPLVLGIRPEHLREAGRGQQAEGPVFQAEIQGRDEISGKTCLQFTMADAEWTACVEPDSRAGAGDTIELAMDVERIHIFDKDTREAVAR